MSSDSWILIGTTLFLGAAALLAPVLSELIKRKGFAADLLIQFRHASPYYVKTRWRSASAPTLDEPVHYFRCEITNNGRSQARRCEVVLEELWIYDASDDPQRMDEFASVNLLIEGRPSIDINPTRRVYCAIGHVSSPPYQGQIEAKSFIDIPGNHASPLRFVFDLSQYPFGQPNCLAPGKYAIKLVLYSENATPCIQYFQITWSGNWQDDPKAALRELVIKLMKPPVAR